MKEAQGAALSFEWTPTVEQPKTVTMADQSTAPQQLCLTPGTMRALAVNVSLRSERAEPAVGRPAAHPSMTPLSQQVTKVFSLFSLSQPQHLEIGALGVAVPRILSGPRASWLVAFVLCLVPLL